VTTTLIHKNIVTMRLSKPFYNKPVPISDPKTKKRRLFKEEISIPVSTPEEVSGPV
jgi:hypothetical protein